MSKNFISTNQELRRGEFLLSPNGQYKAIFQEDSNFVIYQGTKVIWASDTNNHNAHRIVLQDDRNLVMYNTSDKGVWVSNTHRDGQASRLRLTLTDAGTLDLDDNAVQIWSSKTSKGVIGH